MCLALCHLYFPLVHFAVVCVDAWMFNVVYSVIVCSSTAERKSRTSIVTKHNKFFLKHNALSEVRDILFFLLHHCLLKKLLQLPFVARV